MDKIDWPEFERWIEEDLCEDEDERARYMERRAQLRKIKQEDERMEVQTTPIEAKAPEAEQPKAKAETKTKNMNFIAGEALVERVRAHCKTHNVSIGAFCRGAITAALENAAAGDSEVPKAPMERKVTTEPAKPTREGILDAAKDIVCKGRDAQYGSAENNFAAIADLWNAYIKAKGGSPLKPHDVAVMQIHLKTARIATGYSKNDNWVDIAGYAACGGECQGAADD